MTKQKQHYESSLLLMEQELGKQLVALPSAIRKPFEKVLKLSFQAGYQACLDYKNKR